MKRRLDDLMRRVVGFPRADRAIDSVGHISAACANSIVQGVIVTIVEKDGTCDTRIFGEVKRSEMCWAGATLTDASLNIED